MYKPYKGWSEPNEDFMPPVTAATQPDDPDSPVAALGFQPKLIGLHGKARAGKDTVANILKTEFPGLWVGVSFAEPIREGLRAIAGLEDEHFHGKLKEVPLGWVDKSPRQMMQTLGTEWGRHCIADNFWLLLAERQIVKAHMLGLHVVVTDVRFENEAKFLRDAGGSIWHVHRDTRALSVGAAGHASEAGIAFVGGDKNVFNYGDIKYLREQVMNTLDEEDEG